MKMSFHDAPDGSYIWPKVDSDLIHDLLIRELNKNPDDTSTLPP
jgi:hypothetical protein